MEKEIDISLRNLGTVNKNRVTITTPKGSVDLYFNYSTFVAVDGLVSENQWSKTTGKLLNELQPDKKARVPNEEVLAKAQERLKAIL
jgi:hypothetical protein